MLSPRFTRMLRRCARRLALGLCAALVVAAIPLTSGASGRPSASATKRAKSCQPRTRAGSRATPASARRAEARLLAAIGRHRAEIARLRRAGAATHHGAIRRSQRRMTLLRRQLACQARDLTPDSGLRVGVNGYSQGWGTPMASSETVAAPPGVGWVRERFDWNLIEPAPGQYDWSDVDQLELTTARRGVNVLPLLSRAPAWAEPTWDTVPADPSAYASFVAKVVARYGPGGELWAAHPELADQAPAYFELLNEPYYPMYAAGRIDPARYARLVKAAGQAGKAANPQAKFIAASETVVQPTGSSQWVKWTDAMYEAVPDLNNYFDAVAVHPYSKNRPPDAPIKGYIHDKFQRIATIHDDFARHGAGGKALWITEIGWSTCADPRQECVSEATQAAYTGKLCSMVRGRYRSFVGGLFLYQATDRGPDRSSDPEMNYGLAHADGRPKPAWRALQTACTGRGAR